LLFVRHISTVGSKMGMPKHYMVRHGRLPSIILWFVIHEYSAGHEILTFKFSVSDPRVVYPHTCRWSDLFVTGGCSPEPLYIRKK
jgi:hypothetical protein